MNPIILLMDSKYGTILNLGNLFRVGLVTFFCLVSLDSSVVVAKSKAKNVGSLKSKTECGFEHFRIEKGLSVCEANELLYLEAEKCARKVKAKVSKLKVAKPIPKKETTQAMKVRLKSDKANQAKARILIENGKSEIDRLVGKLRTPTPDQKAESGKFNDLVIMDPCYGEKVRAIDILIQDLEAL